MVGIKDKEMGVELEVTDRSFWETENVKWGGIKKSQEKRLAKYTGLVSNGKRDTEEIKYDRIFVTHTEYPGRCSGGVVYVSTKKFSCVPSMFGPGERYVG